MRNLHLIKQHSELSPLAARTPIVAAPRFLIKPKLPSFNPLYRRVMKRKSWKSVQRVRSRKKTIAIRKRLYYLPALIKSTLLCHANKNVRTVGNLSALTKRNLKTKLTRFKLTSYQ